MSPVSDSPNHFQQPLLVCLMMLLIGILGPIKLFGQESPAELSGFEPSEIFDVRDGGKVEPGNVVLARLLHRCFQISEKSLRRAAEHTRELPIQELCDNPRDYRFYPFSVAGTATGFSTHLVDNDANAFDGVHLLHLEDSAGQECLVALPVVNDGQMLSALPHQWPELEKLQQPVEFVGFFMGLRNFESEPQGEDISIAPPSGLRNKTNPPLFVARRIDWYPDRTSEEFGISATDQQLAQAGVDFNQLRQLGNRSSYGIESNEAMSFYQLLKATSQLDAETFPTSTIELETMLREPARCLARPTRITGHIRRVTEIVVEDTEVRRRLGIDRYYQLDMFVPLENRRILIKPPSVPSAEGKSTDGSEGEDLVIENRFPVTVCTCQLPAEKDQLNRNRVTVRGFFFKNWSYESELSLGNQSGARQIAPLIIAIEPEIVPLGPNYFGWILMSFAIAVLGGAAVLAWLMRSKPNESAKAALPEHIEVPKFE